MSSHVTSKINSSSNILSIFYNSMRYFKFNANLSNNLFFLAKILHNWQSCQPTVGQNPKSLAKTLNLNYFVVRFHTRWFSELLISNFKSDFSKTKWRLQNGGHFSKISVRFAWNFIYVGFRSCWFQIWSQIFQKQNGGHFLKISVRFAWNLIYVGFWSCWFQIWSQIFQKRNGGYKMADTFWKFLSDSNET